MNFTLIYWIDDGWYVGKLKEIPGIASQGETLEELQLNIEDAYRLMMEEDAAIPVPHLQTHEIRLKFCSQQIGNDLIYILTMPNRIYDHFFSLNFNLIYSPIAFHF